jgi:membrane-bound metal-dependent hydrolase YbcI (DUF457 family)
MPGYRGHIAGGLTAGSLYAAVIASTFAHSLTEDRQFLAQPQVLVAVVVVAVLFSLWPDVDTNSKGQDIFYGVAFAADIALILTDRFAAAALLGLFAMTPILGKHRGWTHSKVAMVLVPAVVFVVPLLYRPKLLPVAAVIYGAAALGYFSHLLLDGKITKRIRVKCG